MASSLPRLVASVPADGALPEPRVRGSRPSGGQGAPSANLAVGDLVIADGGELYTVVEKLMAASRG